MGEAKVKGLQRKEVGSRRWEVGSISNAFREDRGGVTMKACGSLGPPVQSTAADWFRRAWKGGTYAQEERSGPRLYPRRAPRRHCNHLNPGGVPDPHHHERSREGRYRQVSVEPEGDSEAGHDVCGQ